MMQYGWGPSSFAAGLRQGFSAEVRPEGQEVLAGWGGRRMCRGVGMCEVSQASKKLPRGNGLEAEGCGGLREADGSIVQATGMLAETTEAERESS